jgi:hypothetical protein
MFVLLTDLLEPGGIDDVAEQGLVFCIVNDALALIMT